ncbi:hypothetical protein INR49_018133, partial [Caranx melampygus]
MGLLDDVVFFLFSSPTTFLGAAAVLLILYLISCSFISGEIGKEPPGPKPLPLLGNLLQLDLKRPYKTLFEFSKKYGSVFTVYLGTKKVVVLAGYKTVKEALVSYAEEFGDRDITLFFMRPIKVMCRCMIRILFANGESWKELRRFAITTLRDFGMGKRVAEEKILEESRYLIEMFEEHKGKPFDTSCPVNYATSNIISSIVYGSRFEYDDCQFKNMVRRANETIRITGSASIQLYNMFPRLVSWIKNRKLILKNVEMTVRDVKQLIEQLKETLNLHTCRGLVDCFLIRKQKEEESCVRDTHYHEKNLIFTITNLFSAGTDTTATTLRWGLLLMAKYPDIQDQVQEELSRVIGSRQVRVEDRKNLPYTDAVIHEIQRLADIVPMSLPHKTSRDVTFQGYFIKEGTTVFPLLTSVLYDESEWESPHTFNPSHFLDKEGKFIRRDAFLPFSAGRRVCLGESLAKMELFLFFTLLLQRFHFTPPPGVMEDELDLTPAVGLTLSPSPHMLCAVSRQIMLEDLQSFNSVYLLGAILGLLILHLLFSTFSSRENQTEPPGPKPLPLLGNLFQVDLKRLDSSLFDLSKKYGPVFTVHFGLKKVVVLAGYRTVKQALVNHAEEFGDREVTPIFYDFNKGHGILFSNGDSWKEMRRFALATLRDFGMGKKISEGKIIEECLYLAEEFEQHKGKAFNNSRAIHFAASNIISALMFGKRFEYKDPDLQAMVERDHEIIHLTGSTSILIYNIFPWLGPCLKTWRHIMKNVENGVADIKRIIADLKETLNPDMCRCFVDVFLTRKQSLEESGVKDSHYHDNNLMYSVANLFAAGTDTTGNTLQWFLLFMAKFPDIQDWVQEELSRVAGSRQVRVEDRKNLPYTDAVIHESMRLANIVPMSIPHRTSRDVTFQGYFIKKGTTVFPLLTSVLYDESEWESPRTFNPSHFLDEDGNFIRRDAFMPFSAGRRACLGESLARMEIFLFFTSLLQRFRFTPPPGVTEDDLDLTPVVGFTLTPPPHELCAIIRRTGVGPYSQEERMAAVEDVLLHSTNATTLLGTFVILFILYLLCPSFGTQRKEPPGPWPLPLLGNLLQLDPKSPQRMLYGLYKKYGPVFIVHLGPKKMVVVAGLKAIKQALVNNDAFEDRENPPIITDLKLSHGKAFDTTRPLSYAVSNIICSFVYGNRFEYDDPKFRSMVDQAKQNIQIMGSSSLHLYNTFPWLFRWIGARKRLMKGSFANRNKMMEWIRSSEETLNPQLCRGFVDSFLVRKTQLEASGNMNSHYYTDNLLVSVVNLFTAGTDTTSSTIRYGLLLMAKYPEIQDQVQEELARVVGNRQIRVGDRRSLPYTDAVIHEIQRFANILPILTRCPSQDVTFQGYFIKKGTLVVILLSSALQDEDEWEKAYTFNPSHFLDKEGNFVKRDAFLPFSTGSRSCIGESLAKMEIFLFFTSLLQHFRFTPPPGLTEDELDLTPAALLLHQHLHCQAQAAHLRTQGVDLLLQSTPPSGVLGAW